MLLLLFSEGLKERFQNIVHIALRVHRVVNRYRPNYSPTTNRTPDTHFLVMKWDLMYCVGIFGVSVTTKMKPSFITHEKKRWIDNSVMDTL
jgi:hypothetical protein